jgi:thiol:disulfide interchange protein DsbD
MQIFRRIPLLMLAAIALAVATSRATAVNVPPSEAATEQVRARLISSADTVRAGDELLLGLHQRIIPHWHTYWVNPGDSGTATSIAWDLPKGAAASDIQWPAPGRIKLGPITNYGYENEVVLLSAIKVPADLKAGSTFPVRATVDWLVCEETCIPQQVVLGLALPVVAPSVAVGKSDPLIEKTRADMPVKSPWPVRFEHTGKSLQLRIAAKELKSGQFRDVWFYAAQWGKVSNGDPQPVSNDSDDLVIDLRPGEAPARPGEPLSGVLALTDANGTKRAFAIEEKISGIAPAAEASLPPSASAATSTAGGIADIGFISALLLALAGGMILNLMPCVFPVLSIKALALLNHAEHEPRHARLHGLTYTGGVLASFTVLTLLLLALKSGGAQLGWGFQFQSPLFVLIVAYLMFALGLSLSGVFTIGTSVSGVGSSLAARSGYTGSFFTGVLATIVATPCTAPFMGAAIGYAVVQPPAVLLAVFLSLGLGLALPYLLLSTWPAMQRRLPKPGLWMERIKQGFAFPMYAAAAWLVWVLAQQAGINAVAIALAGMVAIAFAAWLYETTRFSGNLARRSSLAIASVALFAALGGGYAGVQAFSPEAPGAAGTSKTVADGSLWEAYSPERLQVLRAEGRPVFINLTAAWCISCLVNERVALSDDKVINAFRQSGITYLKGDWTNRDPRITALLTEFGRSGVPLYVMYPQGSASTPVVLPQILTPDIVLSAVASAKT